MPRLRFRSHVKQLCGARPGYPVHLERKSVLHLRLELGFDPAAISLVQTVPQARAGQCWHKRLANGKRLGLNEVLDEAAHSLLHV